MLLGAPLQLSTLLRRSENYLEWQTMRHRITNPVLCVLVGRCRSLVGPLASYISMVNYNWNPQCWILIGLIINLFLENTLDGTYFDAKGDTCHAIPCGNILLWTPHWHTAHCPKVVDSNLLCLLLLSGFSATTIRQQTTTTVTTSARTGHPTTQFLDVIVTDVEWRVWNFSMPFFFLKGRRGPLL